MKKLFLFLLPVLLLAGCKPGEENKPAAAGLQIEPKLITCPATGGDYTIEVNSPDGEWTATPSASWIRVMPASGDKGTTEVRVKIDTNKEAEESKGFVTFVSGEEKVELPVSRAAKAAPYLRVVSEKELNTPKEGGSYTVQVESNIKWSIASNTGWAKVNKGVTVNNDNITITVDAATTPEETEAVIVVKPYGEGYDAGSDTIYITRGSTDATSLTVDPESIEAPENGGSFGFTIHSNAKWRVYKSWDMDWVTFKGVTEGHDVGFIGITVDAATSMEALSGIITIEEVRSDNYKPVKTQVYIERAGKAAASLSVNPTTINAKAAGGEFPVEIKSNYPWTASLMGAKYFSISTNKGDGDATMIVTVNPTTDTATVTGHIVISSTFGGEQARINIKREGRYITLALDSDSVVMSCYGDSRKIRIRSNKDWTASSDHGAVSVSNSGGDLVITSSPVNDDKDITALVTVTAGGVVKQYISVTCKGYVSHYNYLPFRVGPNKYVYFSPGNLQYQATTRTWRFAPRQFLFVGGSASGEYGSAGYRGNVYYDGVKSSNNSISNSYNGWIDLFGWGTGYDPTLHSMEDAEYTGFIDWGTQTIHYGDSIYPPSAAKPWRTMTADEWKYLYEERPYAEKLRGMATVNGVEGYVFLPNSILNESGEMIPNLTMLGCSFTPDSKSYAVNVYTPAQWKEMEYMGAIFLPAAGQRQGTVYLYGTEYNYSNRGIMGNYWACTYPATELGDYVDFTDGNNKGWSAGSSRRFGGNSVRLVRDIY